MDKIPKKPKSFQRTVMALVSALTVFTLVVPASADAILLDDITGIFGNALEASDEVTSPLLSVVPKVVVYYSVSLVCLSFSTATLEWVITNPNWINLRGKAVTKGWALTRGMANMFLLLIFLVIAFGFILRIESVDAPKALPRLIIVALLINFSKLFVGMLVDFATIANNTIIYGHEGLLRAATTGLIDSIYATFGVMLMGVVKSILAYVVPLAGLPKVLITISSLLFKGEFISLMPIWISQIVAASALTMIFCLYIILFVARVFIIQILAILSPLAFLCLILPQTQKYWDEWLKHLIQWTFVGTVLLFFLMIGLSAGNALLPSASDPDPFTLGNLFPILNVPKFFIYYMFLFIYLAVSFWMVDRTMPILAVSIMGMSQGLASKAWKMGGKQAKDDLFQRINEKTVSHQERDKEFRDSAGNLTLAGNDRLIHQAKSLAFAPVHGLHRLKRTTPKQAVIKGQMAARERMEKLYGKDDDGVDRFMEAMDANPKLLGQMGATERVGALEYGLRYKGTEFVQSLRRKGVLHDTLQQAAPYSMSNVIKAVGYDPASLQGAKGQAIARTIVKEDSKGKENRHLAEYIHGNIGDAALNQKAALYTGAAKIMEKKDTSDNWDRGVFKINPTDTPEDQQATRDLQEGIAFKASSGQIRNIGDKHGQDVLDAIQGEIVEKDYGKFAVANSKLANAQAINSGTAEVFPAPDDIAYITDPQTGVAKKRKKEQMQERIQGVINEERNRRPGRGQQAGQRAQGGRQRTTGPGQQYWGNQGDDTGDQGNTPPPGGGPGPGTPPPPGGPGPGGGTGGASGGGRAGQRAGAGPESGFGGATRRQQASQRPGQENFGDFGRSRPGSGRNQDARDQANQTTYREQEEERQRNERAAQETGRRYPGEDLRDRDRRDRDGGTTPSGRTTGVYPDDVNRRDRGINGNP